jgi:hypothetical protein
MGNARDGIEQSMNRIAGNRTEPEVTSDGSSRNMARSGTVHPFLA